MYKNLTISSLLGFLAVVFGAFGAHALRTKLSFDALTSFETAVRYQMYHAIVLLFVNGFQGFSERQKNVISYLFFAGILFFSGSIYAITVLEVPAKSIWFVTPLGGLFFILGWTLLFVSFFKKSIIKA